MKIKGRDLAGRVGGQPGWDYVRWCVTELGLAREEAGEGGRS